MLEKTRGQSEPVPDDPSGYRPHPRNPRGAGSEVSLAAWAGGYRVTGFLLLGIGVGLAVLGMLGASVADISSEYVLGIGISALVAGASSLFFAALLHGAADIVRLLKRGLNLPYSGEIEL